MALVLKDRVRETSTTTGTGTFTLVGAATGFQSFSVIGNANTTYYSIVDATAGTWEVGIGTYTSSGTTLSRDTVLESSNSGSKVNFAAGTKDVFCTYPAEKAVTLDDVQTLSNKTLASPSITGAITFADASTQATAATGFGFKNRIINGAMVIDQRNAGASVTPTDGAYTLDRWVCGLSQASKFTVQQTPSATETGFATRVAAGFSNYLACTVAAAANVTLGASDVFAIQQKIEGFNFADMAWGTASAKTVTLSFLAYSSVTGTFGGAMVNSANNRSYPFTYSVPTANTWTTVSVTIAGDTSGTWVGATNGVGAKIWFSLGTGSSGLNTAGAWVGANSYSATGAVSPITTNNATFYITGVQLGKGSTATSFDYRPYGTELQLCQRYYESSAFPATTFGLSQTFTGIVTSSLSIASGRSFAVTKRAAPSVILYSRNNTANAVSLTASGADVVGSSTAGSPVATGFYAIALGTNAVAAAGIEAGYTASAEL